MSEIVVDASTIVDALLHPGDQSALARLNRAGAPRLCTPHLCDAEVLASLRAVVLRRETPAARAAALGQHYRLLALRRFPHGPLLTRAFALRDNFSACDALYVALAESLAIPLLTADSHLANAVRRFTSVELTDV